MEIQPKAKHGIVYRACDTFFRYQGWPSVTRDENGILYAASSAFRMQHVDPSGKTAMFISRDEGETWTKPVVVNDSYFDDRDAGIVSLGGGKLLVTWFSSGPKSYGSDLKELAKQDWMPKGQAAIIPGMVDSWAHVPPEKAEAADGAFIRLSRDGGVTWTEPIRTPVNAPHGPAKMKDGSVLYFGKQWSDPSMIAAYTSRDDGLTWEHTGTVPMPDGCTADMLHEPHVAELPNGRLLGAIRVHTVPVTMYTTFSDDKGKTWSKPMPTGVDGYPPHLMVHSSGAVICSYCRRGGPGNQSERALVSYDNGESWADDYVIHGDVPFCDFGYPASVELSDGSILTVYYQAWADDSWCSTLYTKWKLEK